MFSSRLRSFFCFVKSTSKTEVMRESDENLGMRWEEGVQVSRKKE
jgi:hypothetical protein